MIKIPLRNRYGETIDHTIIDDIDIHLTKFSWYRDSDGYAVRHINIDKKRKLKGMHWFIMNPPVGIQVDHIDGDRLNNCRKNLRLATHAEQAQNRKANSVGVSRFRGVHWSKSEKKWQARVQVNGKRYSVGCFDDEVEAGLAASRFRLDRMTYTNENRSGL